MQPPPAGDNDTSDWEVDELPPNLPHDHVEGLDWEVDPVDSSGKKKSRDSIQQEAAQSFRQFLGHGASSDDDDGGDGDEKGSSSSDSDFADDAIARPRTSVPSSREHEAYEFFSHMLQDNKQDSLGKLYISKKRTSFRCIACAASGRRWKIYPNTSSIVQHARTFTKTKLLAEHRAYGRAIRDFKKGHAMSS